MINNQFHNKSLELHEKLLNVIIQMIQTRNWRLYYKNWLKTISQVALIGPN